MWRYSGKIVQSSVWNIFPEISLRCLSSSSSSSRLIPAIVVGSDCVGASVAYHLTQNGIKDVLVIEPPLPHDPPAACGLASSFHSDVRFRRIHSNSVKLYKRLEAENPGTFFNVGTLRLTGSGDRVPELQYHISRLWENNTYQLTSSDKIKSLLPFVADGAFRCGIFCPDDGYVNEEALRRFLLRCAVLAGAQVVSPAQILGIHQNKESWTVDTDQGSFSGIHLVNAAGIHAKDVGRMTDIELSLAHVAHPYILTKPLSTKLDSFPVFHNLDDGYYIRAEGDRLLIGYVDSSGSQKHILKEFCTNGIPKDFTYDASSRDKQSLQQVLEKVSALAPGLGPLEPEHMLFEPLSLSPDGYPLVGPVAGLTNYWVAAGFGGPCSLAAGGIGEFLANFIVQDEPPFELTAAEANRFTPWANRCLNFVSDKVEETYRLQYADTTPFRTPDRPAGRPTYRVSGLYGAQRKAGAVMHMRSGWEQVSYYATGQDDYMSIINRECAYIMNSAGLIDLSIYGKLEVKGQDAEAFMRYVFASDIPKIGTMGVGYALTPNGKLFSRVRIIHYLGSKNETVFLLLIRPEQENRDFSWLQKIKREKQFNINIGNVTEYLGLIGIVGPQSMDILSALTLTDVNDQTHPHKSARLRRIRNSPCIVCRDTTTGELGFHLYHGRADSFKVYEHLLTEGSKYPGGIANFGRYAFNALRIEKGEKFWGHELTLDYNPMEAGIVDSLNLDHEYVGCSRIREIIQEPAARRLVQLAFNDEGLSNKPFAQGRDPDGFEAVTLDGQIVGHTTSACYGYNIQKFMCFAYLDADVQPGDPLHVRVYGTSVPAEILAAPPMLPVHMRTNEAAASSM